MSLGTVAAMVEYLIASVMILFMGSCTNLKSSLAHILCWLCLKVGIEGWGGGSLTEQSGM